MTDLLAWLSPRLRSVHGYKTFMFLSLYGLLIGVFIKKLAQKQNRLTIYNPEPLSLSLRLSSVPIRQRKGVEQIKIFGICSSLVPQLQLLSRWLSVHPFVRLPSVCRLFSTFAFEVTISEFQKVFMPSPSQPSSFFKICMCVCA